MHAAPPSEADRFFERAGLADIARVSDPALEHYRAFDLQTTATADLLNPRLWMRGATCALSHGFGTQPPAMLAQLPGVFVVRRRDILAAYRHHSPADRPDYLSLIGETSGITMP